MTKVYIVISLGAVCFIKYNQKAFVIANAIAYNLQTMLSAKQLAGWESAGIKDVFTIKYWEFEQAKLK